MAWSWETSSLNPKNWGSKSTGSSNTSVSRDSGDDPISKKMDSDADATMAKNTALQDLQMDLGLIPKNAAYYRDLADRQARSQAAMEQMQNSNDDGPSPAVVAEEAAAEETAATATTTPVEDKTAQIQTVADVATKKKKPKKSTGPAEDAAREFEKKGRKATVLTSMQGLDEEIPKTAEELKKLRSRRSLLAG